MNTGLVGMLLLVAVFAVQAQTPVLEPRPELGLLGGVSFNIHKGNFTQLGQYASCCPEFSTGTGIGSYLGVFATLPISGKWRVMGRLVYSNESGSFLSNENSFVADLRDTPRVVPAVFTHDLQASLSSVSLEPLLAYRAATGLDLLAGLRLGLVTTSTFVQTETLAEPADYGTYLGADRTWVNHSAAIPDASTTRFSATIGARYQIPLTQSGSLFMAPEMFYHLPLTDVTGVADWRVSELRLGIELGWSPEKEQQLPPDPVPAQRPPALVPPTTIATVAFRSLQPNGTLSPLDSVRIEETRVLDLLPVLGHVYFDEGLAEIPTRYRQGAQQAPSKMTTPEQAMQGVLSIIAERMKTSSTRLTLVGSTSNTQKDKGTGLARRRAVAVRDALVALGVPADRLRVEARQLPLMPTRSSNPDDAIQAEQENRRVEIVPTDPELLTPVTLASVRTTIIPEKATVVSTVTSYPGVASSTLKITSAAASTTSRNPTGVYQEDISLAEFMTPEPGRVVATLSVKDSVGNTIIDRDTLPVSMLSVERKRAERRADTEIERYSLILFAFNDAKITSDHERVLDRIRERIRQGAQVRIIGMTDSMGSSDYNRDLSRRRALSVANALSLPESTIQAVGSSSPRFSNASPEGRAYNRTVVIEITTNVR